MPNPPFGELGIFMFSDENRLNRESEAFELMSLLSGRIIAPEPNPPMVDELTTECNEGVIT